MQWPEQDDSGWDLRLGMFSMMLVAITIALDDVEKKVVEAQTRESTSARQQQSRGGFSGRSSALRPPRGCSRAPSVRLLKTAVAVLFFWPRINFQNQFSKPIFTMGFWKSTKNRPGNWPANSKNRSQNRGRNWPGTGGGFCSQFSKPVPEPACLELAIFRGHRPMKSHSKR